MSEGRVKRRRKSSFTDVFSSIEDAKDNDLSLEKAIEHLSKIDSRFKTMAAKYPCIPFTPEGLAEKKNPFQSLCASILSQQLSGAAAKAIGMKFLKLFYTEVDADMAKEMVDHSARKEASTTLEVSAQSIDKRKRKEAKKAVPAPKVSLHKSLIFPSPALVKTKTVEDLREIGISYKKGEYILSLADEFDSGRLSNEFFHTASTEEIYDRLVQLKGIGRWTVEMFLLFCLRRWDILSPGDLGIQRCLAQFAYGQKKMKTKSRYLTEQEMVELTNSWRPYRSIGMWYMWKYEPFLAESAK